MKDCGRQEMAEKPAQRTRWRSLRRAAEQDTFAAVGARELSAVNHGACLRIRKITSYTMHCRLAFHRRIALTTYQAMTCRPARPASGRPSSLDMHPSVNPLLSAPLDLLLNALVPIHDIEREANGTIILGAGQ